MPEVIVVVSFPTQPPMPARAGVVESYWEGQCEGAEDFLLLEFPSETAAREDLRSVVESGLPPEEGAMPGEVHHVEVEDRRGARPADVPLGTYLAVVRHTANPGYGHEGRQDLADMMASFAQLPSYLGHVMGFDEALEEEGWSLVLGTDRANLPVPEGSDGNVKIYRRRA